jgi:quinol-cytochrome oxidoreductase complex cytochrome b subunit
MAKRVRIDYDGSERKSGQSILAPIKSIVKGQMIHVVPSYGNSFFFTIGVYLLELFAILAVTGMIMLIFGPYWWDTTTTGTFIRSVHLWAAEAFVTLMFIHLAVNLSTSAFRKKKLMWIIGSIMLLLVLLQFAFGIGLEGGLVSQVNDQAAADLWNGLGLGFWVNPMNQGAVLGWHVAIVPILLVGLILLHYTIVRRRGLNTPYRKDIPYKMVRANHNSMYRRMAYILAAVLIFSVIFSSPYIPPLTISQAANSQPSNIAITFLNEFNFSSGTATYSDSINPYLFNTRTVYVSRPYGDYVNLTGSKNYEASLLAYNLSEQNTLLSEAYQYFNNGGSISAGLNSSNPAIVLASRLTLMAQMGTYQPFLQSEETSGLDNTYVLRFLVDSGSLNISAQQNGLGVPQYGMLLVGASPWSFQYWLLPYNIMEIVTSNISWWGDLENGLVAFVAFLVLLLLPFIPGLKKLPDKLKLYKIFWNRFTIPELKKKNKR